MDNERKVEEEEFPDYWDTWDSGPFAFDYCANPDCKAILDNDAFEYCDECFRKGYGQEDL